MNFRPTGLLFAVLFVSQLAGAESSGFVSAKGRELLDPAGKPLILRGINLGNWLVPEGYMFRMDAVNSPRLLHQLTAELLGPDAAREFWVRFQDNYITRDDIQLIKDAGFNSVRVPFNYRSFTPEDQPGDKGRGP